MTEEAVSLEVAVYGQPVRVLENLDKRGVKSALMAYTGQDVCVYARHNNDRRNYLIGSVLGDLGMLGWSRDEVFRQLTQPGEHPDATRVRYMVGGQAARVWSYHLFPIESVVNSIWEWWHNDEVSAGYWL